MFTGTKIETVCFGHLVLRQHVLAAPVSSAARRFEGQAETFFCVSFVLHMRFAHMFLLCQACVVTGGAQATWSKKSTTVRVANFLHGTLVAPAGIHV